MTVDRYKLRYIEGLLLGATPAQLDDDMVFASDYDALLAGRDALQQQVESLQNKWAQRPLSVADTAALEAENDALRAALVRYGNHDESCEFLQGMLPCSCGFEAVRSPERDGEKP